MVCGEKRFFEALMGAFVLLLAVGFFYFSYIQSSGFRSGNGYLLGARFEHIDGLVVGSEVRVGGVKVGNVQEVTLDPKNYLAVVRFDVLSGIRIPEDSTAQIISDGFLGGKYLSILPGSQESFLSAGDEILETQSSVSLESLLSKFLFSSTSQKS
ncbi:MAG: outer membrane lipid asymmetry maintenance protein MlaD [Holosporales bacterium]